MKSNKQLGDWTVWKVVAFLGANAGALVAVRAALHAIILGHPGS
jgi:hypothetical protein